MHQRISIACALPQSRSGEEGDRSTLPPEVDRSALLPEAGRMPQQGYLFPGRRGSKSGYLMQARADAILKTACDRVGLEGVSTHSFRQAYITKLRDKGYSPAQIQKQTRHRRRENLMHYFDRV